MQKALDENATSDTIANYEKIYTKYQKLQNKLDSGKTLSKSEQKRYDSYAGQLDGLKARGQSAFTANWQRLRGQRQNSPKRKGYRGKLTASGQTLKAQRHTKI